MEDVAKPQHQYFLIFFPICGGSTPKKVYLQPLLGTPRFRQRLYGQEGEIFKGSWAQMGGPAELQVETLPCNNDFHKDLLLAVKNGDETQVEMARR